MPKQSLKTQELDGDTLHLKYIGGQWELTVEPEYRRNGTHNYDGWLPRYYTKASSAKAAVTRKFGREWIWEEVAPK